LKSPRILFITPPLTQINTPYPATAYLTGFLKKRGFEVYQADLGLELVLEIFSRKGLQQIFNAVKEGGFNKQPAIKRLLRMERDYLNTIEPVIRFLQGKDSTLANRVCYSDFLPQGPRFDINNDLEWTFGHMGITDRARFMCTLYMEDLGDMIRETVCPHFGFSRYAERLGLTATSFDPIEKELNAPLSIVDAMLAELTRRKIEEIRPDMVGFSVPFPGNLYGALISGKYIKENYPHIVTMMGGGYPNTELRSLREKRIFKYIDFITLDDGESPLLRLIEHLQGNRSKEQLHRTYMLDAGEVKYYNGCQDKDIAHTEIGTPDYTGLLLDRYLSVIEIANPMHRLWNDGRWNKLTVAHGCYWKKCSFCDISLDYIARYDAAPASLLADRIEGIVAQTGETGFHFVDEAAPPLVLRDLALEILRRGLSITWWANIRFEKTFTEDLCKLLSASGCIAVSGGLEVASDRLLAKMEKGVTIEQVAKVTHGFTQAGIMVHAYLMYGFPTQTEQETIDSLEVVRQLFEHGVIQSGYWHRLAMTVHSPIGINPAKYGVVKVGPEEGDFASNDLWHEDPTGCDHELYGKGLAKALFNYMHGLLIEEPASYWFDFKVPRTTVPRQLIARAIQQSGKADIMRQHSRALWLGNIPELKKIKDKKQSPVTALQFYDKSGDFEIKANPAVAEWLLKVFPMLLADHPEGIKLKELEALYQAGNIRPFADFLNSSVWQELREKGLLLV
jgi:radical SAM superfamily enzyme YgiQ (UPF0313 family)